ncbi:MAG: CHASE2 domain-containing protein [Microcoleaceae cyanobacterium]
MNQCVVLKFGNGNCQVGFPNVIAQVWEQEQHITTPIQLTGSLPPAPELIKLYEQWRSLYQAVYQYRRFRHRSTPGIELEPSEEPSAISDADLEQINQGLKRCLNQWLDSGSFGRIERQLRARLTPTEAVRVILETEDAQLRRLPWQLWNFFVDYPQAEVALSALEFNRIQPIQRPPRKKVRILAILGNSQGIEVDYDRRILEQLPNADPVFLVEPERHELDRWLWDEQGWDILFFAGHSSSSSRAETGYIEINTHDRLSIDQLRNALKSAIANGLQLAIFNSCDGLGLGRSLADLQIPQLIVMREPVPDRVAQEFLTHWLAAFSRGKSFYQSVREARERLQGLEGEFPCASWLPVICQNPTAVPPTWDTLRRGKSDQTFPRINFRVFNSAPVLGGLVTAIVLGIRFLGGLETLELRAYDHLMRSRPAESADPRLLMITVTGNDVQAQDPQERQGSSLSNAAFDQLLKKLVPLEPRVIAIDIYREIPVDSSYQTLLQQLQSSDRLITMCKVEDDANNPGTPPTIEIPQADHSKRIGFNDVLPDPDKIIRQHLLGMSLPETSACRATHSLSLIIAMRYLADDDISLTNQDDQQLSLGSVTIRNRNLFESSAAGYHGPKESVGYQIMLNYRNTAAIAPQITLTEALEGNRLTPELVKDKIILIGTTDRTFRDLHQTLLGQEEIPGVIVHAHQVSQLLSAVKDGRPLIWWWPTWIEVIWIGVWAGVGIGIAGKFQLVWKGGLLLGISFVALYSGCYLALWKLGGWLPLMPAAIALLATSITIWMQPRFKGIKQPEGRH